MKNKTTPALKITSTARKIKINSAAVARIARKILSAEVSTPGFEAEIHFCSDRAIRALNKKFLKHDYPTDVISFEPQDDMPAFIAVSYDTALSSYRRYGCSPQEELTLYLVHGLLHSAGHEDKGPRRAAMMEKQSYWMNKLKSGSSNIFKYS